MNIINDIAYPQKKTPVISVVSVKPLENHKLWLRFSNGENKVFNFSPLLNVGVFRELQDRELFNSVYLDRGVPVWKDGQIDIAPETLYHQSETKV